MVNVLVLISIVTSAYFSSSEVCSFPLTFWPHYSSYDYCTNLNISATTNTFFLGMLSFQKFDFHRMCASMDTWLFSMSHTTDRRPSEIIIRSMNYNFLRPFLVSLGSLLWQNVNVKILSHLDSEWLYLSIENSSCVYDFIVTTNTGSFTSSY